MYGDFLGNDTTNHVCICTCVILLFTQKYNHFIIVYQLIRILINIINDMDKSS